LAIAHVSTVKISPCCRLACQTCQAMLWSSFTVPSAKTSTRPSRRGTTTQTVHTLAQVFPTCFSWYTLSTAPNVPRTISPQGYMGLKSTPWPTNCSTKQLLTTRVVLCMAWATRTASGRNLHSKCSRKLLRTSSPTCHNVSSHLPRHNV